MQLHASEVRTDASMDTQAECRVPVDLAIDSPSEAAGGEIAVAQEKGVLLYDIMTERHEITTMLQKTFSTIPSVFGELAQGTAEDPAVVKESVHYISKLVSGTPIKRPAWLRGRALHR